MISFSVCFHVCRRAPRRQHDLQSAPISRFRICQHRENIFFHPRKREALKRRIGFVTIRFVVGERKIAAVDGNTHEAILHLPLPKVFTQHLLFLLRVHQRIDIGRRIRNSPAETIHPLICNLRVQIDQLIFPASVIAKWDRLFLGNSFFSFVCG